MQTTAGRNPSQAVPNKECTNRSAHMRETRYDARLLGGSLLLQNWVCNRIANAFTGPRCVL